jgi:hypothetical protein
MSVLENENKYYYYITPSEFVNLSKLNDDIYFQDIPTFHTDICVVF